MNVYSNLDYKLYLLHQTKTHKNQYGYKSKMAEAAGCQKSFLSQVLNADAHLTPEHALGLGDFWRLNPKESEYFVTQVHYARAGNKRLKEFVKAKLEYLRTEIEHLGKRFKQHEISDPEGSTIYYSSWHYAAVHILLSVPGLNSADAIAARLSLSPAIVTSTLNTLESLGLVRKTDKTWASNFKSLHLARESALQPVNLNNWRQRAVLNSQNRNPNDVHYTAIHSIARKDIQRLKELTIDFLESSRSIVRPSPEEELLCLNLDLFVV